MIPLIRTSGRGPLLLASLFGIALVILPIGNTNGQPLGETVVSETVSEANRPAATDTPLFKAAQKLITGEPTKTEDWRRMIDLAVELKQAVSKDLPFNPYEKQLDFRGHASFPNAKPGRHTLIGDVRYAATRPPGPGESYINTCAVYLDCDLVATSLRGPVLNTNGEPKPFDGYIHSSVVVVNGRIRTTSYIYNSIVVAAGPIEIEGYIYNSLVISLEDLLSHDGDQPISAEAAKEAETKATVKVDDGYINHAVVVGAVECEDLRDCVILGVPIGREPYLRGAEVMSAGGVARLPWEVGKQK